ncbi:hypothetical protein Bmyc01_53210 [Bacillus mycoides]|nr:hypothetical protein Bmyc01_53210 [Bacillus mycoides]
MGAVARYDGSEFKLKCLSISGDSGEGSPQHVITPYYGIINIDRKLKIGSGKMDA